jgi:hypothetical protein
MKTQKQLIEAQRKQLDERFHAKYPNGQFVLQYRFDMGLKARGEDHYNIHWHPRRSTSHCRYKGISVQQNTKSNTVSHHDYQNNSFGRCNSYDSLDKLCAACIKKDVPEGLIGAFVLRYERRAAEGF